MSVVTRTCHHPKSTRLIFAVDNVFDPGTGQSRLTEHIECRDDQSILGVAQPMSFVLFT